ncbi:MAG: hypothetical protein COB85_08070, partial [Bacteroidetes bacterium]
MMDNTPLVYIFKCLTILLLACFPYYSHSQHFWTEDFGTACSQHNSANGFVGTNGTWSVATTGSNGTEGSEWYVSAAEAGMGVGNCGDGCLSNSALLNRTLHVSAGQGWVGDLGAAYEIGGFCGIVICIEANIRAETPLIDCSGKDSITLCFSYMENGQGTIDDATLWYNDGSTWAQIDTLA